MQQAAVSSKRGTETVCQMRHAATMPTRRAPSAHRSCGPSHRSISILSILLSIAVCSMTTLPIKLGQWENQQRIFSIDHDKPAGLPSPDPTRSFWTHSSPDANPLAREGSTGPLTADADVCIIGSGLTGVGVAYHLSEAIATSAELQSLKVVVLEARDFCASSLLLVCFVRLTFRFAYRCRRDR